MTLAKKARAFPKRSSARKEKHRRFGIEVKTDVPEASGFGLTFAVLAPP
jgi:hypothetical protein